MGLARDTKTCHPFTRTLAGPGCGGKVMKMAVRITWLALHWRDAGIELHPQHLISKQPFNRTLRINADSFGGRNPW